MTKFIGAKQAKKAMELIDFLSEGGCETLIDYLRPSTELEFAMALSNIDVDKLYHHAGIAERK